MFRRFEDLVDPYAAPPAEDTPPARLWPFLWQNLAPLRGVFAVILAVSAAVGAIEVGLVWYAGRVVDTLDGTPPSEVWARHGLELVLVAAAILFLRPLVQFLQAALLNLSLIPNVATLFRWRAHRHVLRQSVGWFQNDFAGRIANRIMQTAPAAGEAVYQVFDALTYAVIYIIGATWLLAGVDPRLAIPLLVWVALYVALMIWSVPRVARASEEFAAARSDVTGRIVDGYTNIQAVKLFAHTRAEEAYAHEAIEDTRRKFGRQMRIVTIMDVGLAGLNGFLIVAVIGYAVWMWSNGAATLGTIAAASALTLKLNAMTGWIMWAVSSLFQNLGTIAEGMRPSRSRST